MTMHLPSDCFNAQLEARILQIEVLIYKILPQLFVFGNILITMIHLLSIKIDG